jgi:hypothetical protein
MLKTRPKQLKLDIASPDLRGTNTLAYFPPPSVKQK